MAKFKVVHDRPTCIGCSACAGVCPDFWEMNDDGKSNLKGSTKKDGDQYELELDDPKCNESAAKSCPVNCIHLFEGETKKI